MYKVYEGLDWSDSEDNSFARASACILPIAESLNAWSKILGYLVMRQRHRKRNEVRHLRKEIPGE